MEHQHDKLLQRQNRFFAEQKEEKYLPRSSYGLDGESKEELSDNTSRIEGTSTKLEKPYFRLTTAPSMDNVRGEEILMVALQMIKKKWVESPDYSYTSGTK